MKLKIGLIRGYLPPDVIGGAEVRVLIHAKLLAKMGHEVYVFARTKSSRPSRKCINGYVIIYRSVLNIPFIRFFMDILKFLKDVKILRSTKSFLIAYNFIIPGVLAFFASVIYKIPFAIWVRDNYSYKVASPWKKALIKFIVRKSRVIIFQTESNLQEFLDYVLKYWGRLMYEDVKRKTTVITEGIEPQECKGPEADYILFVGRLDPIKGLDILVKAFKNLPQDLGPRPKLYIVGDGPFRKEVEILSKDAIDIELVGEVPHEKVLLLMKKAMFLVLPSYSEGFPNVILEAMSVGLPVIATAVGGVPNLVEDGVTGLLVPPGDAKKLTEAMARLIRDSKLRNKLGQNAYKRISRWTLDKTYSDLKQILESTFADRR